MFKYILIISILFIIGCDAPIREKAETICSDPTEYCVPREQYLKMLDECGTVAKTAFCKSILLKNVPDCDDRDTIRQGVVKCG